MSGIVVCTNELGKAFPLHHRSNSTRITEGLVQLAKSIWQREPPEEFWALQDVSLNIKQGEVVGLVGRNGAGKSTLLKLLSRILHPTTGRIELHGRIGSLLEVGTGFHPELTGRENIFLNGAILGMTRQEITKKFDEIVAFAEVDKFLDMPVKRYSSGMVVRLAFSVAAYLEPEIMLVDEVLAVGDVAFQRKCLGRLQDLSTNSGRTVILVSHNPSSLATLCKRGILLEGGRVTFDGPIHETLQHYKMESGGHGRTWEGSSGDEQLRLTRAWIKPKQGNDDIWDTSSELEVGATIEIRQPVDGLIFGFRLHSDYEYELVYSLHDDDDPGIGETLNPCRLTQTWHIPPNTLASGRYRIAFDVGIAFRKQVHRQPFGELQFELQNLTGIGRRYPIQSMRGYDSLLRPNWAAERRIEPIFT